MEERYINMSRRSPGRREASARRRDEVWDEPPRRRVREDDWDEPPRKRGGGGRSALASAVTGAYKFLVAVSAIIVAVYLGVTFFVRAPKQNQLPAPSQNGTGTVPAGAAEDPDDSTAGLTRRPGVYNIFLAATDAEGIRTDTMMVMCYDTEEQTVGVVSVPRDTLVARASGNPHLVYGTGGVESRVEDVSHMLGIPIDYYIKVNIQGFITLVDYLGGIDFYVPCNMNYDDPYQDLYIHYTQGQQTLSGQQAMEVARFRKNNDGSGYSDTGRTETQQKLLVALAKKVLAWGSITKINGFVEIFNQNVDTDLSMSDMLYFAAQGLNLDPSSGVETATLPGRGDAVYRGSTWCYELDPEGTLDIVNRLINPYSRNMELTDMNLAKADRYTQG